MNTIELAKWDDRDVWLIQCQPHIALRLKRVFGKLSRRARGGGLVLLASEENSRDLEWFATRYPMECKQPEVLERLARGYDRRRQAVVDILGGTAPLADLQMALPARAYQRTAAELAKTTGGLLVADELGLGKAQPLHAPVLTPGGWRPIGSLRPGDRVCDPEGGVARVRSVHPQGRREIFRITTSDGATAECCDDHLWLVQTANDRSRGGDRVVPLRTIRKKLILHSGGNHLSRWFLPLPAPVDLNQVGEVTVDPYLLGVLIGDGMLKKNAIVLSNPEPEILHRVDEILGPQGIVRRPAGGCDYRLSTDGTRNPLVQEVRALGLEGCRSWEKFIPAAYRTASPAVRLALLRGLMDSDGDCTRGGTCIFNTSSERLAADVVELVQLLGGIATLGSRIPTYEYRGERRKGRRAYRVNVRLPVPPFSLSRKAARWHLPYMARSIRRVESIGEQEVICVALDSKRQTYLTSGAIVTHNTVVGITLFADPALRPALVVVPTHLQRQWKAEIERFLPFAYVHIAKRGKPYDTSHGGRSPDVLILTYHKLHGWAEHAAGRFPALVFDEVQDLRRRVESFGQMTRRWEAAELLSTHATVRLGLSATPIYNYGDEFWNVLEILRPGALGSHEEFVREWCAGWGRKNPIRDPKAFGSYLRESGLMLRRTRREVGRELPALSRIVESVSSKPIDLAADTSDLARLILAEGGPGFEKMRAGSELDYRMRQATGVAKAPYVAGFVRLLLEQGPVVLFGWHRLVYDAWAEAFVDLKPAWYTGTESPAKKAAELQRFIGRDTDLLIMSLRSGSGVDGIQQRASQVVIGELDWSPGVHEQCLGRLHRDGQRDPVMAYYLVSGEGSDPVVADVLDLKRQQIEGVAEPEGALSQATSVDPDHVKKLARAYLER